MGISKKMGRSIYAYKTLIRVCFAIFRVNEDTAEISTTISATDTLNVCEEWWIFMQNIGDNPLGYVLLILGVLILVKILEVVLSGGTDRIKDRYNDNQSITVAIFLMIFTAFFFFGATPISNTLGVDKDTILFISFITFIISILLFKFNNK